MRYIFLQPHNQLNLKKAITTKTFFVASNGEPYCEVGLIAVYVLTANAKATCNFAGG